eukprot:7046275-Prymnesium_polylepis.1
MVHLGRAADTSMDILTAAPRVKAHSASPVVMRTNATLGHALAQQRATALADSRAAVNHHLCRGG